MDKTDLIVVTGPTASGKTAFAAHLAKELNGEIISADSRQVYRGMDLGTGKDIEDYTVAGQKIPYHLIDICDPGNPYNVYSFQKDFIGAYRDIIGREKQAILCGGTGMYIEAVLKGYRLIEVPPDEEFRASIKHKTDQELIQELKGLSSLHNTSDISTRKRLERALEIARYYHNHPREEQDYPRFDYHIIGIRFDRASERKRITQRLEARLNEGMIDEAKILVEKYGLEQMEYFGLEYKFLAWYLKGKISHEELFTQLNTAIHQFAKRQMTWFRRMQKNGFKIFWIDGYTPIEQKLEMAKKHLSVR